MLSEQRLRLWAAWPEGYLAAPGVLFTRGGHLCFVIEDEVYFLDPEDGPRIVLNKNTGQGQRGIAHQIFRELPGLLEGAFLPNVNPNDTATWSCLLLDLARARGWEGKDENGNEVAVTGLTWCVISEWGSRAWVLRVYWNSPHKAHHETYTFGSTVDTNLDTDDPATALVEARVQCRKWAAP
jgi:hypothetical protein